MKFALFSLFSATLFGVCANENLLEPVTVDDAIVQMLVRKGTYTLSGGARVKEIKTALRELTLRTYCAMWIKWILLLLSNQMFANYYAEEVSVQDEIAQKLAYMGKWYINKGGVTTSVKKAVREPVPAGWKYTIIMDVTKYGSLATEECLVVGVYDVKTGDIWLSNPDPINPVPCTETRR